MRRRTLIAGLAATAGARGAFAQSASQSLRLGFVHPVSPKDVPPLYVEFIARLRELGYVEGGNLIVEYINLEGHFERIDEAMRELVRRKVDVIYALGQEQNLRAAVAATKSIPIVMLAIGFDPLAKGYVTSFARPGGNVTGLYSLSIPYTQKALEILTQAFPELRAGFGFWDFDTGEAWRAALQIAPRFGLSLIGVELRELPYDYERGFQEVPAANRAAMFLATSAGFVRDLERLAEFALRHRLISAVATDRYVEVGGLMSYAPDYAAATRRAAEFVDRIAHGAKPSDLPIEQPTKFILKINLKTAKAIGATLSSAVLIRADEVIE